MDLADGPWPIDRHRTAISRDRLSAPMQALDRHGLFAEDRSVLDYGCGQGDDVRALVAAGIRAVGWDPYFAADVPLEPADIVNLGFVLNVIEDRVERREALARAYGLARQCLAVAGLVVGKGDTTGLQPFKDGFLTRRGTFQKYFRQDELGAFIAEVLGEEAIAVAHGVFFVFPDKLLEQRFLLERQQRREAAAVVPVGVGSPRRAERPARRQLDPAALAASSRQRRDDLLVYFALNLFARRTRYAELPPELRRDVKALFGSHARAQEAARELLFSVGQGPVIDAACRAAHEHGVGWLAEGEYLQLPTELLTRLPAALRCYVGCAAKLYGDVETAHLLKIHIRSGKVSLMTYDQFDSSPLPRLRERIKIDLRAQDIDCYDYSGRPAAPILYLKSRFMAADQDGYARQQAFDESLRQLGLFDFSSFGPEPERFFATLAANGYAVDERAFALFRRDRE
ncbi:MAG: DNA phosphorothioation-associated putative methyltransferase [Candidatus Schekmanbacteria bacterium]|nr:DNA phosphorothioation-associated putative methyltransferase [Candidatus Schekmanbacteria bacterium]